MSKVNVVGSEVGVVTIQDADYISITDIARYKDADRSDYIIQNWLRNRNTIEFLGVWEQLYNPGFKSIEFDGIRKQAGLNRLNRIAIQQMHLLSDDTGVRGLLKGGA